MSDKEKIDKLNFIIDKLVKCACGQCLNIDSQPGICNICAVKKLAHKAETIVNKES